jgi:hypothetical protein
MRTCVTTDAIEMLSSSITDFLSQPYYVGWL